MNKVLKPTSTHMTNLDKITNTNAVNSLTMQLDEIFRNGIKEPAQVAYVYQLLKNYYNLTNTEYKLNKENSIV